jgi:hypothetical protein
MYTLIWNSSSIQCAVEMFEGGYHLRDIALRLGVSIRTVSRYKSTFLDAFVETKIIEISSTSKTSYSGVLEKPTTINALYQIKNENGKKN